MDISKVDKNYANTYSYAGMVTHSIHEPVFTMYGCCREEGETDYKRLPHSLPPKLDNEPVRVLYTNTSGIRVRFQTDSRRIILKCVLPGVNKLTNMPFTGSAGFDMYADGHYCSVFHPGMNLEGDPTEWQDPEHGYASGYVFPQRKLRDILINFPLYNDVSEVYIAIEEGARLLKGTPYRHTKPVVFYGSSITQGGCASHPGNCYTHMISRRLDMDFINLGFSGGCRAEPELGEYIAGLDMRVFVLDYDHNAPDVDHLRRTHWRIYRQVREKQPALPIILVSAADHAFEDYLQRRQVILKTYEDALAAGDRNVYFVDGTQIYAEIGIGYCLVDAAHPNDLGFWCMANAVGEVVKQCLETDAG